jgi:hypothetical protein
MADITPLEAGTSEEPQAQTAGEETSAPIDLINGNFGFHFTTDAGIPDVLEHGLLSRHEETRLGLHVRRKESRMPGNTLAFTTDVNDLYFSSYGAQPIKPTHEALMAVVGIVVDRPHSIGEQTHDWYGEVRDKVAPVDIKAFVIIDKIAVMKQAWEKTNSHDVYRFLGPLPEEEIQTHVDALGTMMKEVGITIPIYGVSGKRYAPSTTNYPVT